MGKQKNLQITETEEITTKLKGKNRLTSTSIFRKSVSQKFKMGKDYLGKDMRKANVPEEKEEEKEIKALDEGDIVLLKTYGQGPYSKALKQVETDISETIKRVNELAGIKVIAASLLKVFIDITFKTFFRNLTLDLDL